MADLLDIAPSTAVTIVPISDDRTVDVRGLHGNAIASLVARFPGLVVLLAGGEDILSRLIGQFGPAIGPIIAVGCGHLGDKNAEQIGSTLLLEDQIKLLTVIYRLTFPNGWAALIALMSDMQTGAAEQNTKIVRVRLKKSPSASPPLSNADSRLTMQ